ncbi:uncharacterized protein LOC107741190 isoform X2 [Sinocyclocheilus rhinocerous]|uniref:Uncharacterized LOC107741190 n=1 Tax=Sinocyclocheilus rhinocerous TaxID=307959 RepID=A0A673NFA3_9TELE|nr:PREDICTED: uncharacterized protein LOC107741190 isoform X2 [Sinocyclocheilus rhinocerous]
MEAKSNNEFQIVFSEATHSDSTIQCHLSPGISAVNMEIRWFKETDCVYFYKNKRLIKGESYEGIKSLCIDELERGIVSLQLKDVRESYAGYYLCQVTSGDRTEEITVRKSLKTHEDQTEMPQQTATLWTKQTDKAWTDKERIKMANSALLAVFYCLEKDAPKEDLQGNTEVEENQNETEEKDTQQEETSGHMHESTNLLVMETSTCLLEEQETKPGNQILHLGNQQPGCSSQKSPDSDFTNPGQIQNQEWEQSVCKNEVRSQQVKMKRQKMGNNEPSTEEVKVFSILAGKTNNCHKDFVTLLRNQIENLREVGTVDKSDIIFVFCPIVSRAGTDIDDALNKSNYSTGSKLTVLVVLHHTFDPEKVVPDSSRSVNRTDILTVDYLFYEDTGLLKCQKNSDSTNKVLNWLIKQGSERGVKICPRQNEIHHNIFSSWWSSFSQRRLT